MKLRIAIIAALIGFFGLAPIVKAADSGISGLIISPPIKELEAKPGVPFSDVIRVTNPNSSTDLKVDVTIEDFQAQGEDGQQTFIDPASNTNTFSMGKWITVEKSFNLKGDETKEIPYSINVPTNAEPGGHYGVIFFSPSLFNPAALAGTGVMAVPKVGSLMLVNIPGDIKYNGRITEFGVLKKFYINSKNTISFLTRFENLGSTHVKPHGDIVIKNTLGKSVATIPVNDKLGNVLPDSIRRFESQWEKKYGFGLYSASVNLTFGDNQTVNAVLSFWIIPWKETAGGLVLLIIILFIFRHLKWRNSKQPNGKEESPEETPAKPASVPEPTPAPEQAAASKSESTPPTTPEPAEPTPESTVSAPEPPSAPEQPSTPAQAVTSEPNQDPPTSTPPVSTL